MEVIISLRTRFAYKLTFQNAICDHLRAMFAGVYERGMLDQFRRGRNKKNRFINSELTDLTDV